MQKKTESIAFTPSDSNFVGEIAMKKFLLAVTLILGLFFCQFVGVAQAWEMTGITFNEGDILWVYLYKCMDCGEKALEVRYLGYSSNNAYTIRDDRSEHYVNHTRFKTIEYIKYELRNGQWVELDHKYY